MNSMKFNLNPDLGLQFLNITVSDKRTDLLINRKVGLRFVPQVRDSQLVISMMGKVIKDEIKFSGGFLQISLNKKHKPTLKDPIIFDIIASG